MKTLTFDIMIDDKFVCTLSLQVDVGMIDEYVSWGGVIQPVINADVLHERILGLRPSLRDKDFRACLI